MNNPFKINNYFLNANHRLNKFSQKESVIRDKRKYYEEISLFLKKCINNPKKIIFFCYKNTQISEKISCEKKIIFNNEKKTEKKNFKINLNSKTINNCDHIILADTEHQKNLVSNLKFLNENMANNSRLILISKSLVWMFFINFFRKFFLSNKYKTNFLPFIYMKELFNSQGFELIRNEKIIFCPFNIPIIDKFLNSIFRLPILNFFCFINITVFKKKNDNKKIRKISFIIPCKDEEKNIELIKKKILSANFSKNTEFIFGDDKSKDKTKKLILNLKRQIGKKHKVILYNGPGICKSKNVYKGVEIASGDVIIIYDADLTVTFEDISYCIDLLSRSNTDFINCTRMIYPQQAKAMKTINFFGNIFFATLFSILFKQKITDTLCGTKIFYREDWKKIKKFNSTWGMIDKWGDFDLLIGAFQNNLKISEVPIHYKNRIAGQTKMNSLVSNTLRMIIIVMSAFYKLKIKR